ncbi:MAG: ABC transporter ATP-binding protein [Clostridia bacterium]
MTDALKLTDVSKKYDDFLLDNVSFNLPCGAIMGFVGENGAGKSTTIRLILNMARRDSGEISVLGHDAEDVMSDIGVVIDETGFSNMMTASGVNAVLRRIYKNWDEAEYRRITDSFELPAKKTIKEYSRGMKMKLAIAAAMAHHPKLLVLDEATSGLDPIVRDELLEIFREFVRDGEHSVFLSSHITSDLQKICDYITFIHKGKIIFSEQKDELMLKYAIVNGTEDELHACGISDIIAIRSERDGTRAMLLRENVPSGMEYKPADIEDIMLFMIREGSK